MVIVHSDYLQENNCGALLIFVKFKENGKVRTLPAAADSRQLPKSYCAKSSLLGELAAFVHGIIAMRCILEFVPFILKTDSLSLVFLLVRRFDTKIVLNNRQFSHLCVAMQPFSFVAGK